MFGRFWNQVKTWKRGIRWCLFSKIKKYWILLRLEKTFKEKDKITKHTRVDFKRNKNSIISYPSPYHKFIWLFWWLRIYLLNNGIHEWWKSGSKIWKKKSFRKTGCSYRKTSMLSPKVHAYLKYYSSRH